MLTQVKRHKKASTDSRARRREEPPLEAVSYPPFPEHLLDGTETTQGEVMDKVFPPDVLARQYWRLLYATVPFKRRDGTGGETADPATQLRTLQAIDDRKNGKPAMGSAPLPKAPAEAPTDDLANLVEAAKTSPMLRERLAKRLREQLAKLNDLPGG